MCMNDELTCHSLTKTLVYEQCMNDDNAKNTRHRAAVLAKRMHAANIDIILDAACYKTYANRRELLRSKTVIWGQFGANLG